MKVGDLVRRTVPLPNVDKIFGIVLKISIDNKSCEVIWPSGYRSLPFIKNLEVINESA
jgi:hypothetical protein